MMRQRPFVVLPGSTVLARIPLLAAVDNGVGPTGTVDPLVAEGMWLSSRQINARWLPGTQVNDSRLEATVRAYDRRARFRPTPRGVFVGVQTATLAGRRAELRLGSGHRPRSIPSPTWLAAVAELALDLPEVTQRLRFSTSSLARRRGQRLEHEQQAPDMGAPRLATVRATEATMLILQICEAGATYSEIVSVIGDKWPEVLETRVRDTLVEMTRFGFLISDLLPDSLNDAPLGHLLGKLPEDCVLREPLERLRDHLSAADRHPPGAPARFASLTAARDLCDGISRQESPICVDVIADAHIVLPEDLADEAAEAVGLLWRLGHARGTLAGYHARFVDRFGACRFVPLLEAVDSVLGVGDVTAETEIESDPMSSRRVNILAALLGDAVVQGRVEVALDGTTIATL